MPRNKEKKAAYDKAYKERNKERDKEAKAAYDKAYREKNKEAMAAYDKAYREKNKEAKVAYGKVYGKVYREKNKERIAMRKIAHLCTEEGFISCLYTSCKMRNKDRQSEDPSIEDFNLSKEEFLELWTEHKAKQGITCGYTGEPLVMQRKIARKDGKRNIPAKNLLSTDRLNSEKGYTKENIVFCGWAFNKRKNSISVADCKLILQKHEERNQ